MNLKVFYGNSLRLIVEIRFLIMRLVVSGRWELGVDSPIRSRILQTVAVFCVGGQESMALAKCPARSETQPVVSR